MSRGYEVLTGPRMPAQSMLLPCAPLLLALWADGRPPLCCVLCVPCFATAASVGRLKRQMAEICVRAVLAVADLPRKDVNLDLIKVGWGGRICGCGGGGVFVRVYAWIACVFGEGAGGAASKG